MFFSTRNIMLYWKNIILGFVKRNPYRSDTIFNYLYSRQFECKCISDIEGRYRVHLHGH